MGASAGSSSVMDPFGNTPFAQAGRFNQQFGRPLSLAFGGGKNASPNSPFGQFLSQGQQVLPEYQQQSNALGQDIATRNPQLFGQFQNQVQQYMKALPQYTGAANSALGGAQKIEEQAFSPIQSDSLYQNALNQSLTSSREGAAGRGLLDSGSQQNLEDTTARDLSAQFAQQRTGNELAATQNLGSQAGNAAGIAGLGPQASQALFNALGQYAQNQQSAISMPFNALQQQLGFLSGTQNPTLALLQATAPVIGQHNKSGGFWG